MCTLEKITERIKHYEDKIKQYTGNKQHEHRIPVHQKLLQFWKNQLIKHQKSCSQPLHYQKPSN